MGKKRSVRRSEGDAIPHQPLRGAVAVADRLRLLDREQRHAVLATDSEGQPYTSLVAFALLPDLSGAVFATPKDTAKYRNIASNRNVALLVDNRTNRPASYVEAEAVTILGRAVPVRKGKRWRDLAALFIAKHPRLSDFLQAGTTALVLIEASWYVHVGRFQSVSELKVR